MTVRLSQSIHLLAPGQDAAPSLELRLSLLERSSRDGRSPLEFSIRACTASVDIAAAPTNAIDSESKAKHVSSRRFQLKALRRTRASAASDRPAESASANARVRRI